MKSHLPANAYQINILFLPIFTNQSYKMNLLANKVAIITGASRGIGEGIALKLAEHGAHVAFTYLSSEEKALALEERLKNFGGKAKAYRSNAGIYQDCE